MPALPSAAPASYDPASYDDATARSSRPPMTVDLARKYDLRVPRYTSYPTAPHFGPSVDAGRYGDWLSALDPATPLSLYLHIPFCDEMCWFCGCYTKIVQRYQPIRAYLDALMAEVTLVAASLPGRLPVRHVHWGGGSPTMLAPADWLELVGCLRRHFDVVADAELAVEVDPRDATEDYVAALATAGVNRVSIGVQDFDAVVQEAINRRQPYEVVARVCGWLRTHGITRINLDLMYGLPKQTTDGVVRMVNRALTLDPGRVALFGYAHVPWMKSHQKQIDEAALPDAGERYRQASAAASALQAGGLVPVGLDHFAHPDDELARALAGDRLHRNFQGYTTDEAPVLLGLGASAIGSLPAGYVQNIAPLKQYGEAIAAGRLPIARGIALTADDRPRREIIERLMCALGVDIGAVCRRHHLPPDTFARELAALAPLVDDGLVILAGDQVEITAAGRPFARIVAAAFDSYLDRTEIRHSRAV
ncbi:MAG: oxygen-independent coproporphyrinogen III oxidase [Rhodospirillales bacterium]